MTGREKERERARNTARCRNGDRLHCEKKKSEKIRSSENYWAFFLEFNE